MSFPEVVRTPRLVLRRPTADDVDAVYALHSDPRMHWFAPHTVMTRRAQAEEVLASWCAAWEAHGYGYWLAEHRDDAEGAAFRLLGGVRPFGSVGPVVGVTGMRPADGYANLAYRFMPDLQGHGLATEAVRASLVTGTEWLDVPLRALASEINVPSVSTAIRCGMERAGSARHPDQLPAEPPLTVFEAPTVRAVTAFDDAARAEVLDLWCRVNDAGDAVGLLPGASRQQVAVALDEHVEDMAAGRAVACLMRAPDGVLRGLGWWVAGPNPLQSHTRTAYRVMVDPERRGRGLGRVLVAGMHRVARSDGVELAILDYRSGTGIGRFSESCGYAEVGRVPRAIRVAPGDDRDSVTTVRRLDGGDLAPDGRT